MKKILILVAALCITHLTFAQADKLDALINAYAKMHKFNGAALVAKNGVILLNKGYGYRNAAGKIANTEQTVLLLSIYLLIRPGYLIIPTTETLWRTRLLNQPAGKK